MEHTQQVFQLIVRIFLLLNKRFISPECDMKRGPKRNEMNKREENENYKCRTHIDNTNDI